MEAPVRTVADLSMKHGERLRLGTQNERGPRDGMDPNLKKLKRQDTLTGERRDLLIIATESSLFGE